MTHSSFLQNLAWGLNNYAPFARDDLVSVYSSCLLNVALLVFTLEAICYIAGSISRLSGRDNGTLCLVYSNSCLCFNVTSQSSISLLMTLTMAGQCVLTHDMVSIGAVIVGKIFGRSLEVIAVFVLFVIAGNFGLFLLDFRFEEI
jgi:hypothetical protein